MNRSAEALARRRTEMNFELHVNSPVFDLDTILEASRVMWYYGITCRLNLKHNFFTRRGYARADLFSRHQRPTPAWTTSVSHFSISRSPALFSGPDSWICLSSVMRFTGAIFVASVATSCAFQLPSLGLVSLHPSLLRYLLHLSISTWLKYLLYTTRSHPS